MALFSDTNYNVTDHIVNIQQTTTPTIQSMHKAY